MNKLNNEETRLVAPGGSGHEQGRVGPTRTDLLDKHSPTAQPLQDDGPMHAQPRLPRIPAIFAVDGAFTGGPSCWCRLVTGLFSAFNELVI